MAGVRASYYSRWRRQSTSGGRFPDGRSRTPEEGRPAAVGYRYVSWKGLAANRRGTRAAVPADLVEVPDPFGADFKALGTQQRSFKRAVSAVPS